MDKVLNSGNVNEIEQEKQTQTSDKVLVSPETNGTVMNGNGKHNGNGHASHINDVVKGKPISEVAHKKKLVLFMKETEHPQHDKMLLDDVKRLLLGSSGSDEVGLEIESQGSLVVMDWKPVKVDASEELQENLKNTLGDYGGVSVQSLMF